MPRSNTGVACHGPSFVGSCKQHTGAVYFGKSRAAMEKARRDGPIAPTQVAPDFSCPRVPGRAVVRRAPGSVTLWRVETNPPLRLAVHQPACTAPSASDWPD